jgi:hypothetical protein
VTGTAVLLDRMADYFELYSTYPQVVTETEWRDRVSRQRADQIVNKQAEKKVLIRLFGVHAQMAVADLYEHAHVGRYLDRAADVILHWRPKTGMGCSPRYSPRIKPRTPDLSKLQAARFIDPNVNN